MAIKHSQLIRDAIEYLSLNGYFVWENKTGGTPTDRGGFVTYGKPGSADIIGIMSDGSGRHLEMEAKIPPDTQSKKQKVHQMMIERHGGVYIVFRTIEELAVALQRHRRSP